MSGEPLTVSPGQLAGLRNLARKKAGEAVDWISIADARALTDLGLAVRNQEGWLITQAGEVALAQAPPAVRVAAEPKLPNTIQINRSRKPL